MSWSRRDLGAGGGKGKRRVTRYTAAAKDAISNSRENVFQPVVYHRGVL